MRKSTIAILGLASLVAVGAAGLVIYQQPEPVTLATAPGQSMFPGLAERLDRVRLIEIRGHDKAFSIRRAEDGSWGLAEKDGFPVRTDRVRQALIGFAEIKAIEERTSDPALYANLNVQDPAEPGAESLLVTLRDGDGQELAALILGKRRVRTGGNVPEAIYVRKPQEARSWLAEGGPAIHSEANLWLDRDLFDIRRERVREVVNQAPDGGKLVVRRAAPGEQKLEVVGLPEGAKLDESKLEELPRALEYTVFSDVQRADKLADAKPAGSSRFATFDGVVLTVDLLKSGDKTWVTLSPAFDPALVAPAVASSGKADDAKPEAAKAEGAAETSAPNALPEEIKSPEEARKEAEEWSRRYAGWAFELPEWKIEYFTRQMAGLLAEEKKEEESGRSPS